MLKDITIGKIAVLGFCAVSMYFNFTFGMAMGIMYGACFVLADLMKMNLLKWAETAWKNKKYSAAAISVIAFTICTGFSLLSAYGVYSKEKDAMFGGANAVKADFTRQNDIKHDIEQDLKSLGKHRAVAAIQADIKAQESREIFWNEKRSKQCTNATAPESKSFCDALGQLRIELATAADALPKIAKLEKRLEQVQSKLDSFDLSVVHKSSDAQLEGLSLLTGMNIEKLVTYLAIAFTLLVEVNSAFGIWLYSSSKDPEQERLKREIAIQKQNTKVAKEKVIKEKAKVKQISLYPTDQDGLKRFFTEYACITNQEADMVKATDLFDLYQQFCLDEKIPIPLQKTEFGTKLKGDLSLQRKRLNEAPRPTVYMGVKVLYRNSNIVPFSVSKLA